MFLDPFSPPPMPRNEHEARIVWVIFVVTWSISLILLFWQGSREIKTDKDTKPPAVPAPEKNDTTPE